MNPAAIQRAKKAERLASEAREAPPEPKKIPTTPEEARSLAWREYRRHTRPFRRAFRGIITRREAERFVRVRLKRQERAVGGVS